MKYINHYSHKARRASALLLVLTGLVMIGGGLAAFFALSLLEDNDLNTLELSKELDSIAMTGIELAAQAINQSAGGLDFVSSQNSFIFVDEDIDGDLIADGAGFGTYTAAFDETDFPLEQIGAYDLIITVSRKSEASNIKGSVRTVGDPRKVVITAEVRDSKDNRKRLKAVYYKPWFNGNLADITKPQAENWFFIKSGTSTDEPMASYDSSERGGLGQANPITSSNHIDYQAQTRTNDSEEAYDLHPLRIEKTAWLTEFQNGAGEGGSTAEPGIFYRAAYDDAIHSSTSYYFDAEINIISKLARAVDEVDLVDATYENSGFKSSVNLGRFAVPSGTNYMPEWKVDYMPHQGFFNNYIPYVKSAPIPVGTPAIPSAGGVVTVDSQINTATTITADININADNVTLYIMADNVVFNNSANIIVNANNFTIVVDNSVNEFTIQNRVYSTGANADNTANILLVAEGNSKIYLGDNKNDASTGFVTAYNRALPYKVSLDYFIGSIYAPQADVFVEKLIGLSISKNLMCSGYYLHNRAFNAAHINAAHNGNLGINPIQVDHSDNSIYPADTTKYYLLSVEDDSGRTES